MMGAILDTVACAARERIKSSHRLTNDPGRLNDFYRDWAEDYDADVAEERYRGPDVIADLTHSLHTAFCTGSPDEQTVLDAGCGTGLAGIALARRGFTTIDGFDLSPEMVDRARATGRYRALHGEVDLHRPPENLAQPSWDLVVCCGVFTTGHVSPGCLWHLLDFARDDGLVVVSTRRSYYRGTSFAAELEALTQSGRADLVCSLRDGGYVAEESGHYWALRKRAVENEASARGAAR